MSMRSDAIGFAQPDRADAVNRPGRLALGAACVTVALGGSGFVAIRSAGQHFSPGALALGRLLPGVLVLSVIWLGRREGWPPRAAWPGIAACGVRWFWVYMVAVNWGERQGGGGAAARVTKNTAA